MSEPDPAQIPDRLATPATDALQPPDEPPRRSLLEIAGLTGYCFGRLIERGGQWFIDGEPVTEAEARGFMAACEEMP
jgi:hypothetical protein